MTASPKDLTRWNRSGLTRFRYLDGNAVTFFETLRQTLAEKFRDPVSGEVLWRQLEELLPEGQERKSAAEQLLARYRNLTGDLGVELARTLARATHILTEHLDLFANESYLGTATQWEHVRKLVAMLDYHPAPPASASTALVLLAKKEKQGTLAKGFQVKNAPADGSAPVVFETLEDVEIDAALNGLRPRGWNCSPEPLGSTGLGLFAAAEKDATAGGDLAVLVDATGSQGFALRVTGRSAAGALSLTLLQGGSAWQNWPRGEAKLLARAQRRFQPRLNGDDVIHLDRPHGLGAGESLAWKKSNGDWWYAKAAEAEGQALRLSGSEMPGAGTELYRVVTIPASIGQVILYPQEYRAISTRKSGRADHLAGYIATLHTASSPEYGFASGYRRLAGYSLAAVYLVPEDAKPVGAAAAAPAAGVLEFPGAPEPLAGGDWVIGETTSGMKALRIAAVTKRKDGFALSFTTAPGALKGLHGPFRHESRPGGWNRNDTPLDATFPLETAALPLPALLTVGRAVILEREGDPTAAFKTFITERNEAAGTLTLAAPPAPESGFVLADAVLRGNVVSAGHGETRPPKVLGSGAAGTPEQHFRLAVAGIAHLADASFPSGVRADLEIEVGTRIWQQVPSLNDSGPADPHYEVRLTEEGFAEIRFGDGRAGRRLPTGSNNVRVRFRQGTGGSGNLSPFSLSKLAKPHALAEGVRQPLDTTGGNAMEGVESLRDNAPAGLLCLERAVSLADITHLASRHSGVWQARAFLLPAGGRCRQSVRLVVVPAGGGPLGGLREELAAHLAWHLIPGVELQLEGYQPLPLHLKIEIQSDSAAYDPTLVEGQVRALLCQALGLQRMQLGRPLFKSQVAMLIEGVEGVENAHVRILDDTLKDSAGAPIAVRRLDRGDDQLPRAIWPQPQQLIHLSADPGALLITVSTYQP
jgi:hypothetical protein